MVTPSVPNSSVTEPEEVFEITDFTDVSEWERFISGLEEVILAWGLHAKSLDDNNEATRVWKEQSETVSFGGFLFVVSRHWMTGSQTPTENAIFQDLMSHDYDFTSLDLHPVHRHYGLTEFVTIFPDGGQSIQHESRIKLLLSSVNVALHNTKCRTPVFVQVYHKWQECFAGVFIQDHLRTDFEVIHLKRIPKPCCYLSGLIDMFKAKIATPTANSVEVSIRFTYYLADGLPWKWPEEELNVDDLGADFNVKRVGVMPYGASSDPVEKVVLFCIWPSLSEDSVVDSEVYSDLNPIQAPVWKVAVGFKDDVVGRLSEALQKFIANCKLKQSLRNVLGRHYKPNPNSDEKDYGSALGSLTDTLRVSTRIANQFPIPAVTTMVQRHQQRKEEGPLDEEIVSSLVYFLFPDADEDFLKEFGYTQERSLLLMSRVHDGNVHLLEQISNLRSAPVDSLTWRIGLVLLFLLRATNDFTILAYVWQEIVLELRYRYIHGHLLPGVSDGGPNLGFSLFHQKLQMLNCCIKRRLVREQELLGDVKDDKSQSKVERSLSSTDSDDEFYDAIEEQDSAKAEGRKEKHESLRLLKNGEALYIPVMQEMPPLTEDMLEEQAATLLELGSDSQGSETRARMLAASLQSDMEAFKAANPGAILEDFIRWYSPRDWIEDDSLPEKGKLSQRMEIPGNIWVETWINCRAVPARRQRRIFDDTKEAEKILDYFFTLLPGQVLTMLLPSVFHAAILRLLEEPPIGVTQLGPMLSKTVAKLGKTLQMSPQELDSFEEILHLFTWLENSLGQVASLHQKFSLEDFIMTTELQEQLTDGATVEISGASKRSFGKAVRKLFEKVNKERNLIVRADSSDSVVDIFNKPDEREFILRATANRPTVNSSPGPQRMYCSFQNQEVRIAGAFTQDTCFR